MAYINGKEILFSVNGGDVLSHNASTNAHEDLFNALKDRITALEGGAGGKGMLYIYKALKDEILDWGDEDYFYIELNGRHIELDTAFFNSCLYLDFGGTSAEAGVYVYPYEGTLKLYIYEAVDISVNGELGSAGEHYTVTFTAPQDAHVTLA